MLIDGHLRKETIPDAQLPVLVLDVSEEEAEKILLTLDPLAAMAESDSERIKDLLATVQTNSEAVQDLFKRIPGDRLWETLHPEDVKEVEVSPDRADELRAKSDTETGQIWQVGPHRLLCGDCRAQSEIAYLWDKIPQRARLIWTDPPYGVSYTDKNRLLNRSDRGNRIQKPIANDDLSEKDIGALFSDALAVASGYCEPGAFVYGYGAGQTSAGTFHQRAQGSGLRFPQLPRVDQASLRARNERLPFSPRIDLVRLAEERFPSLEQPSLARLRFRGRQASHERSPPDHETDRVDCPHDRQ